jgi:protein ImuB
MLWLCLRFHQLPLQALTRQQASTVQAAATPVAIIEKQRVLQADDTATEAGIKPGQSIATVRALAGTITLLERDPAAETRCLQQLCCWAYNITPALCSYRQDSLLLEVGSCLALYRGLDNVLAKVRSDLSCRAYTYCSGLAATPKAAWLLSHTDQDQDQALQLDLEQQLAPLPLKLLPGFSRQLDALAKAGLWLFSDILALPQQALARRCGREFTHLLQQILGTAEDRQLAFQPPDEFCDDYWFGYEVKANQELQPAIQILLQSLCQFLRNTQLQCQQIEWRLYGINHQLRSFEVRSTLPQSSWQEWHKLTQIKVEQLQLDIGVEWISLSCAQLVAGQAHNHDLFSQAQREPLHSLLDRLQNRLGLQAVEKIACRDEHLPEFAGYSNTDQHTDPAANSSYTGQRPFWLMPQPQPLRYSRQQLYWNGRLTLLQGPERIEDNWWLDAVSRDYYVARDSQGQQYWVFRDRLRENWYIQGIFA